MKKDTIRLCIAVLICSGVAFADSASALFQQPWQWKDERGEVVTFSKWRGMPIVVTMFYTSCKFRCPRTLDKLRETDAAFARSNRHAHFVLVTLDPRSDTPERLKAFKTAQHLPAESWHLLSGAERDTRALSRFLGVRPAYDDAHVDHEVRIVIFDAEGNIERRIEGWNFDGDEVAR